MALASPRPPHPLKQLTVTETNTARDVTLSLHQDAVLEFREIFLHEPPKKELIQFLELEHAGQITDSTPRPRRLAKVKYDVITPSSSSASSDKTRAPIEFHESIINVVLKERAEHTVVSSEYHASLTFHEFTTFVQTCEASPLYQHAISTLELPPGFEIVIEPWPYGGMDASEENARYFQGLLFAQDKSKGNDDANFYAFPVPLIPVMDWAQKKIIKVLELATGGGKQSLEPLSAMTEVGGGGGGVVDGAAAAAGQKEKKKKKKRVIDHCRASEYAPELLGGEEEEGEKAERRPALKPLHIVQPEGPSFQVSDEGLVEWQNWRMRLSFNSREGAVLHDLTYQGRGVLHRLSMSEMTVPYADPREPYHRKQAFDFGDGGAGNCANNLTLGCDCLGVIKYFDGVTTGPDGTGRVAPNVVCLHEQDNGIGWKHTNWRTGRAVVTRRRELVFQFIITLANYEYAFYYILDQAGGVTVQVRATGIVSVVNVSPGAQASGECREYGNVVSPGALAQNHQHIFCVRVDPAVDGHRNTVVQQESLPVPMGAGSGNPRGNLYRVHETPVTVSGGVDAAPHRHRVFKIQNRLAPRNPVSGNCVAYKISPPATQLLLADPGSMQARRARFAAHHLWVTRHRDHEFYAGGPYTLQSNREVGGVGDAADRNEAVEDEDLVVWSVFGLTHNPRVEDWPVMPVEMLELHITPSDFFTRNPAIDVPSNKDLVSRFAGTGGSHCQKECC